MLKPKSGEVRKPTRTISGITPIAVMLPPRKCKHGECLYCPNLNVPQSYTPKSPVVLRAREVNYDSYKQTEARIKAFKAMNHPTDKIELIIMGGTFLQYPKKFQYDFIKGCYDALNNKISNNLENAKKLNEKSKHRCTALCIETRPDVCSKYIKRMREFGATRVELGVQLIDDKVYSKINRGHKVKDVIECTEALRNAGFKVGYHIMPGLLGSDFKNDLKLFKKLFSDERFKPDQLKLYPCQVLKGSELENLYWKKKFKPYTKEQTEKILIEMLKNVPRYCRVMRVMREIPPEYLVAGTIRIDLRKDIEEELRRKNSKLKEIRYREIGFALRDNKEVNKVSMDLKLKITEYKASNGREFFLEIVNKDDILFGLLRLRIFEEELHSQVRDIDRNLLINKHKIKDYDINSLKISLNKNKANKSKKINKGEMKAIIRELHVYGKSLKLGQRIKGISQHQGIGKWLMTSAEEIVAGEKIKKLSVISGVGVRDYYRRLGYKLGKDGYMIKVF